MAVDWRNPVNSLDVSGDGFISPLDALQPINELNDNGPHALADQRPGNKPYWDASGDQFISPLDALQVINALNSNQIVPYVLGEGPQIAAEQSVTITVGQTTGTRTYRLQVTPNFDTTDASASSDDLLAIYLVDPQQPATTLLDRGTPGTTLFTLSESGAEFAPGRVRWDGEIVEIDLSELTGRDTAELRLQLLNTDGDRGSRVAVRPLTNEVDANGVIGPKLIETTTPAAAGAAINLTGLATADDVNVHVENVRFSSVTQRYAADLRLQNTGDSLGRSVAVAFPDLPTGVTLRNPSGSTADGDPYINFAPAISRGGLSQNGRSEPLLVEFDDPARVSFALTPQILAGANQPPTLTAIGPLTVMPGGKLATQLTATDPDGDVITFSLGATGSGSGGTGSASALLNLPTGILRGNGLLEFSPSPNQLGQYTFDVIASDGALETQQTVTLDVVADPNTTTRVSGFILDVDQSPLAGMQVEIGAVQGLTLSDGSFTLDLGSGPVVGDTIKVRGELFPGPLVYPFIAEKLAFILEHEVFPAVNNVIDRPIFLPPLDVAGGTTIDPMQATLVQQEVAPGEMAEVFVAAGTLMNQQGTPFTGTLSITKVPAEFTPAALPENLGSGLVVTIQPGEMVFAQPAPLTLPNTEGYASGTILDLWSINPVTGEFDIVGASQVSPDGSTVNTVSGGIRNSSWHTVRPAPRNPTPAKNNQRTANDGVKESSKGVGNKPCKFSCPTTSGVEFHSGALIEMHDLVPYRSLGESRGLTLTYDSERADPRPIIHISYPNVDPAFYSVPSAVRLIAKISVSRGDFSHQVPGYAGSEFGLTGDEHIWSVPLAPGPIDVALQADLRDQPSGSYDYEITSGVRGFAGSRGFLGTSTTDSNSLLLVNSIQSPFGSGWGLAGLIQLVENPDGSVLWVDGDGSEEIFLPPTTPGESYLSPPGEFSVFEKLPAGTYRMTTPHQMVYLFDAANRIASVSDRNANQTQYQYNTAGLLTTIIDPVGLETTFANNGSRITSITDPAGRVTQLGYDAVGNLSRITDPDDTFRTFGYDAGHRMTSETDKRGNVETETYGFAGRTTLSVRKDGSRILVSPVQTRGLLPPEATIDPLNAPLALATAATQASFVDANGRVSQFTLDQAGQLVAGTDGVGRLPSVERDAQNLVTVAFDARRNKSTFTYDGRGNLLSDTIVLDPGDTVLEFDGADDEVSIGDRLDLGTSDFTIEAWIKGDPTMEDWGRILDKGFQSGYSLHRIANTRKVGFEFLGSGNGFGTTSDLIDNTWHHVAVVKAGTTVRLFADGNLENTTSVSGASQDSSLPLLIGWNPGEGVRGHWKGQLDEIRIWTVARTEAEIHETMFQPPDDSASELAAHYQFRPELDDVVSDATANSNDGVLGSGIPANRPDYAPSTSPFVLGTAPTDKALSFDGVNDEASVGDRLDMGTSDFTLEAWIKGDPTMEQWARILDKGFATGYSLYRIASTNQVGFTFLDPGGQHAFFGTSSSVIDSTWHHVAVVKQGADVRIYADGVEEGADTMSTAAQDNSLPLLIGWNPGEGIPGHWKGRLDEIRIWTQARTEAEIQADMNRSLIGNEAGLAAYFRFDESSGDTAFDQTANGNDAALGSGVAANQPTYVFSTLPFLAVQGSPGTTATRMYTYDSAFSQLASNTDEIGRTTLYAIDPTNGNTLSETRVVGAVGGPDDVVTQFMYTPQGLVDTMTDPLGRVTNYDYDARGRLVTATAADGTADQGVTRIEYDDVGNTTAFIDENNHRTQFAYDALNRLTRMTQPDPDGAGPLASPVTEFAYDAAGNVVEQTDPRGNTTQFEYDVLNRVTLATDATGGVSRFGYDAVGNLTSALDELGRQTQFAYDARNRLLEMNDPDGGNTRFGYDIDDNTTSIIDPNGNRTDFAFDARSRRTRETDPLGHSIVYEFNGADDLAAKTDRDGRRIEYTYDDLRRRVSESWSGGNNVVQFGYDKASNLTTATDSFSSLAFAYDARNRITSMDNVGTPGAPQVALTYNFDPASNITSVADSIDGAAHGLITHTYDTLDRLSQITQTGTGVADKRVDLVYNPLGQFASITRFADLAGQQMVANSLYTYDPLNRLTDLTHSSAIGPVSFFGFAYDAASQITRLTDVDGVTDYSYDARSEVTGAAHADPTNPDESYSYDANGNRTTSHEHGSGYQTGPGNRLLSDSTFNYAYDNEGNLIRRTEIATGNVREFQWDHRNRLTAVLDKTAGGTTVQQIDSTYDVFDRRIGHAVATTVDSVLTHFVYDRDSVLLEFVDSDGPAGPNAAALENYYLHGPVVDQVFAQDSGGANVQWLLADHLGSVRDLVDNTGSVVNHRSYDSFGNLIAQTNSAVSSRYGFTGREFDAATGLYFYRARYYDASSGRFLNEDPLGFGGNDVNLFRYVGNDPLSQIDPFGLEARGCPPESQSGGVTASLPTEKEVKIVGISEDVAVRTQDGAWRDLAPGETLPGGAEIHTGADSFVIVQFADGTTLKLSELTEIKVATLLNPKGRPAVELMLKLGQAKAKVVRQQNLTTDFSFKTPTRTAGVRG